jgi:hypothetical protein
MCKKGTPATDFCFPGALDNNVEELGKVGEEGDNIGK